MEIHVGFIQAWADDVKFIYNGRLEGIPEDENKDGKIDKRSRTKLIMNNSLHG
jgi:hypothetical protein